MTSKVRKLEPHTAPARLDTPTDLSDDAVREVSAALNALLADTFALYVKTKNFHWHVSGPHFRDYHLLLDEQGEQLEGSIDILAERVRKIGGTTIRSVGQIAKLQRVNDNDKDYVAPIDMLHELMNDNKAQIRTCARPTSSRRARGRRDGQPAGELHRRDRETLLVPVRGKPRSRAYGSLTEWRTRKQYGQQRGAETEGSQGRILSPARLRGS